MTIVSILSEFFDGDGFLFRIGGDGDIFEGTNNAFDGALDLFTFQPSTNAATLITGGRELLTAPDFDNFNSGDVATTRRIYVPATESFARVLDTFTNLTNTAQTLTLTYETNLGSNANTAILDADLGFIVSDDSVDGSGGFTPIVTQVFGNNGGSILPTVTQPFTGEFEYNFTFTLAPGASASLLFFLAQDFDVTEALADVDNLADPSANFLTGLEQADLNQIVNFGFGAAGIDILGSELDDVLEGDVRSNQIIGLGGNDALYGELGDDTLLGELGDDLITGDDGEDLAVGGLGDDFIDGGQSDDILIGDVQGGINGETDSGGEESTAATEIPNTGQTISITLNAPDNSNSTTENVFGIVSNTGAAGSEFNVAFIVDVSGSTSDTFVGNISPGDQNNDGDIDSILDAEILGIDSLNQSIINDVGAPNANIALIPFDNSSVTELVTFADADLNNNNVNDVTEALRLLRAGGSTNFAAPLQQAINFFNNQGSGQNLVFFLSDGMVNRGGVFTDEVATLIDPNGINATIRAIGVGSGSSLPDLDLVDDGIANMSATQVLSPEELNASLLGTAVNPADIDRVEILVDGVVVETIGASSLTSTPLGLRFDATLTGLSPTDGETIVARVIANDSAATTASTSQFLGPLPSGGQFGDDTIFGGQGNDEIIGNGGNDVLSGGRDRDTIFGNAGNDAIDGGLDEDSLVGGDGNDTIFGLAGIDIINGSAGNDDISGGSEGDSLIGSLGNDTVTGDIGNDTIDGGSGNDVLNGSFDDDLIIGNAGDDTLNGEGQNDELAGGAGNDAVNGGNGFDTLTGGAGNDTLNGEGNADEISAGDGNDLAIGGDGTDVVNGGTGEDTLSGGEGDDNLNGDIGDDQINGSNGNDFVNGGNGNDILGGNNGNDTVVGGGQNDFANGGSGDDIVNGEAGFDTVFGGDGNDTLSGGLNADSLNGGSGSDSIIAGDGIDIADGGSGSDTIFGGTGSDTLNGGSGVDVISGDLNDDSINGGAGNDLLDGSVGNDTIIGGADNDLINGGQDNDDLFGSAANDTIFGGVGDDFASGDLDDDEIFGENGSDTLDGSFGNDTVVGGGQNDALFGGNGDDFVSGENGFDTVSGGQGDDFVLGGENADILNGDDGNDTINGGNGTDNLNGGRDNDSLVGGAGNDNLNGNLGNDTLSGDLDDDNLSGGSGDDLLLGSFGADALNGGGNNDQLFGGSQNDTLDGAAGFDTLSGDNGNDVLTGGINADIFVFGNQFGDDEITDFEATNPNEKIDFSGLTNITDFADLMANHLSQVGGDTIITDGANTITLVGVAISTLDGSDFIF